MRLRRFISDSLPALLLVLVLACPSVAEASGNFGLGAMVGDPSGLSAKLWLDGKRAINGGLAYSLNESLLLQADYVIHSGDVGQALGSNEAVLKQTRPYLGIGGVLFVSGYRRNNNDTALAVRIPLGLEWRSQRLGVFAEIAPGVGLIPSTFSLLNGAVGVRYFFP